MSSIGRNAKVLADMIRKLAGLSVPAPVTLNTQLLAQPAPFSIPAIVKARLDEIKATGDGKDKAKVDEVKAKSLPVPTTGKPGYSERGAPEDWDTAMGEVYGYRWWYLPVLDALAGYIGSRPPRDPRQQGILYGANRQPWADGRQVAVCTSLRMGFSYPAIMTRPPVVHEPPETREACGCGFWAYFNRGLEVRDVLSQDFSGVIPAVFSCGAAIPVFGVIKGTGRVIIGEKGFRSQYAQVMGLCVPPVAVEQLSWWIKAGRPSDSYGAFRSLYTYGEVNPLYNSLPREKCTEEEHVTRISEVEGLLSATYPSTRVFSSQELLTRYFPPDENYA